MYKRDIINFLFILSFPVYGIGTYISAYKSPSMGYLISISPELVILLFYSIDLLYKRVFQIKLNGIYILMLLYIASAITAMFVALGKGLPEASLLITVTKSILLLIPFHAFIVVILYNKEREAGLVLLTVISLSLLLLINIVGFFGLGLSNQVHSIDGRLNFPFLDSFYSGASLLAIINLLLVYYLRDAYSKPLQFALLAVFFLFNLALFFMINSRLATLIFLFVGALTVFRVIRVKGLYLLSMFMIPILLNSGVVIYKILQLPGLVTVLKRVDVEDVTTFNGRSYLWQDAMDWLTKSQENLMLGNGYKGHYFLGLIADVAKLWNEKEVHHMHLHSTSLEILVCQGIVFFTVFAILLYKVYTYFREKNRMGTPDGALFPVMVFLLFIMQVDTFVYDDSLGFVILSLLVACAAITERAPVKPGIKINRDKTLSAKLVNRQFNNYALYSNSCS